MAIRIVGVDLPQNKRGEIALTYIYGIGRSAANTILAKAGIDKDIKVKDWNDDQAAKVREIIGAEFKVEGDLRSEVQLNIKRLMDIGCYRGVRHRNGLPVRGQSTKNNARTRKGKKKGRTKAEFFREEYEALQPRVPGLFDDIVPQKQQDLFNETTAH